MPMVIKTIVKDTVDRGSGLFAVERIAKGGIVFQDDPSFDRIFSSEDVDAMPEVLREFVHFYASYDKVKKEYYLDTDNTKFLNHSDTPNITYIEHEGVMIAARDIESGEELTSDYREYDDPSKEDNFGFQVK